MCLMLGKHGAGDFAETHGSGSQWPLWGRALCFGKGQAAGLIVLLRFWPLDYKGGQ